MKTLLAVILFAASAFGQLTFNGDAIFKGYNDMSVGSWRPPEVLYSALPSVGSSTGSVYVVKDATSAGGCGGGGGSFRSLCRSTGSVWESLGGAGGGIAAYEQTFSSSTTWTITGATHGFGTSALIIACFNSASPRLLTPCGTTSLDNTTHDVVITWPSAQAGKVVINGATGPAGPSATIAKGTATLGTSLVTAGTCATVVTVTATGADATSPNYDTISVDFSGDASTITGYAPTSGGSLSIHKYITANAVNFKVCNSTSADKTPSAATLLWRVIR